MEIRKQAPLKPSPQAKLRTYNEVVEYLDAHWDVPTKKNLDRMVQLDAAFDHPSKKVNALLVGGTNGKSLTVHLTAKLLRAEGLRVGSFAAPHILTYNERLSLNLESISNKLFSEIGNDVINMAETLGIEAHSSELLTIMALIYFVNQEADVAILEVAQGGTYDPVNICNAIVACITRVTPSNVLTTDEQLIPIIKDMVGIVKKNTWVVSGDQSKSNLELMGTLTEKLQGNWAMPIRKLAPLPYPFEQLHGRCATLAERLAQMFMERHFNKGVTITADTLLSKQKGKRGRPTLEDKKRIEEAPRKTVDQFWRLETSELPARFQLLDREKPSILLDNASNIDAFKNVLLGIRLLHYQRPLKGLVIILAAAKDTLHNEEFLKLVRYFFKKTSGQVFICPLESSLPGIHEETSWDVEKVTNDIKSMKIKARVCTNFAEAFDSAKKVVDEKYGLIVITGSTTVINTYWHNKGIKKFA